MRMRLGAFSGAVSSASRSLAAGRTCGWDVVVGRISREQAGRDAGIADVRARDLRADALWRDQ